MTNSHSSAQLAEPQSFDTPPATRSPPLPSLAATASSSQALAESQALVELSDYELLTQLATLVQQEQGLTVAILVHLAEVERRELHLAKGCSSLFAYCVDRLHFSEDVAYKRVGASRYGRRFPMALDLLSQGALHLSALMLVGPHLTDGNHREWLTAVRGKSKREVERFVATRCPKPDLPASVRKLPKRQAQAPSNGDAAAPPSQQAEERPSNGANAVGVTQSSRADATRIEVEHAVRPALMGDAEASRPNSTEAVFDSDTQASRSSATEAAMGVEPQPSRSCARAADRPRVQPLSGTTYRIVFTAAEVFRQKLERARELCSHSVAPGDLPALFERALDLLIEREEKRRCAVRSPKSEKTKGNREIPAAPPPVPRRQQEPDPAAPIEPEQRSPEPTVSVKTKERAMHPIGSVDTQTLVVPERAPFACSHEQSQGSVELFSAKEFSRYVPAAVRRAVWERDAGQCTFVDDEGNRCTSRHFLEIDHIDTYARGGPTAIGNCRLLCRAHNMHRAKLTFGTDFMVRARSRTSSK